MKSVSVEVGNSDVRRVLLLDKYVFVFGVCES